MRYNISDLRSEIRKEFGYYTEKVAAEIYGKIYYLTEVEVRFLQVKAKKAAQESDEAFEEFCNNIIIYSGKAKRNSKHIMKFQKDGSFANDFEYQFYTLDMELAKEII